MQNLESNQMCNIVKESIIYVLEIDSVNGNDNFFDVGGCSLTALDVIDKIHKETGKKIPLREFLQEPTPDALSNILNRLN